MAILKSAVRRGDPDEEFSDLLQTLDSLCDSRSGGMYISQNTLEQIQHFGFEKRNARWQATLLAIFRRTLGDALGREQDETGRLIEKESEGGSSGQQASA